MMRLFKSLIKLFVFLVLFSFNQGLTEKKPKIVMVYDYDGKGDQAFNDAAFLGMQKVEKELGLKMIELEARTAKSAKRTLKVHLAEGVEFVIFIGYNLASLANQIADEYPSKKLVLIDYIVKHKNITSLLFKEHESSFLAGYMAAKMSKTKKIGFLGGIPIPPLKRFETGYIQGAKYADPNVKVSIKYMDDNLRNHSVWNNVARAKKMARDIYSKDNDILYGVAGGSNGGVFEAARETSKFAIGVDINQNHIVPGTILTSTLKRVDMAVYLAAKGYKSDTLFKGIKYLGIAENGVGLAIDKNTEKLVPEKILEEIKSLKKKISDGQLVISESNK